MSHYTINQIESALRKLCLRYPEIYITSKGIADNTEKEYSPDDRDVKQVGELLEQLVNKSIAEKVTVTSVPKYYRESQSTQSGYRIVQKL